MRAALMRAVRRELTDLGWLGASAAFVVVIWRMVLGWRPGFSMSSMDGVIFEFPLFSELARVGGRLEQFTLRPELLGGVRLDSSYGVPSPVRWLLGAGVSPFDCQAAIAFALQAAYAFLAARAAVALAGSWGCEPRRWQGPASCFAFAFLPAAAWRLCYGQWEFVLASLVFIGVCALLLAVREGTATLTLFLLVAALATLSFQTIWQQPNVYWMSLGLPILAGLWFEGGAARRRSGAIALVAVAGGLGLALPELHRLLDSFLGSENARSVSSDGVTYSYATASVRDWLSSLTWGYPLVDDHREAILRHESNFALGPILLALLAAPWRRSKKLLVGLAASAFLIFAFSVNLEPVSTLLLKLVPPLRYFRVPARAALLLSCFAPIVCAAAVLRACGSKENQVPVRALAGAAALTVLVALLPGWFRELALLALFGPALLLLERRPGSARWGAAALVFLGPWTVGAISGFQDRILAPRDLGERLSQLETARAFIRRSAPELASPLVRAEVELGTSVLENNLGFHLGVSTLQGYFHPSRRFLELVSSLSGLRYDPQVVNFDRALVDRAGPALARLYDVRYRVAAPSGALAVSPRGGETYGEAWFPKRLVRVGTIEEAARVLASPENDGAPLVTGDREVPAEVVALKLPADCALARVVSVKAGIEAGLIAVEYRSPADCVLAVSSNFVGGLKARSGAVERAVFPIYGALIGTVAPRGTGTVELRPDLSVPVWARIGQLAGALALLLGAALVVNFPASRSP